MLNLSPVSNILIVQFTSLSTFEAITNIGLHKEGFCMPNDDNGPNILFVVFIRPTYILFYNT